MGSSAPPPHPQHPQATSALVLAMADLDGEDMDAADFELDEGEEGGAGGEMESLLADEYDPFAADDDEDDVVSVGRAVECWGAEAEGRQTLTVVEPLTCSRLPRPPKQDERREEKVAFSFGKRRKRAVGGVFGSAEDDDDAVDGEGQEAGEQKQAEGEQTKADGGESVEFSTLDELEQHTRSGDGDEGGRAARRDHEGGDGEEQRTERRGLPPRDRDERGRDERGRDGRGRDGRGRDERGRGERGRGERGRDDRGRDERGRDDDRGRGEWRRGGAEGGGGSRGPGRGDGRDSYDRRDRYERGPDERRGGWRGGDRDMPQGREPPARRWQQGGRDGDEGRRSHPAPFDAEGGYERRGGGYDRDHDERADRGPHPGRGGGGARPPRHLDGMLRACATLPWPRAAYRLDTR